jgi:hypothetical protein
LTFIVHAQDLIKNPNYQLENPNLKIENLPSQDISLIKKENGKEEISGQAKIIDDYFISNISENEFLNKFSNFTPGFKNLEISIEADRPIFKKENFYYPLSFFDKIKTLFGFENLSEYRLIKEIKNNPEDIETNLNTKALELMTFYKKSNDQEINGGERIKQTLLFKNTSGNEVNLKLNLVHSLETDKISFGGREYLISETPQLLSAQTSTLLYFYSNGKKFTYDFSDFSNYNPEVWVYKKNNQNLLLVKISLFLSSGSSINIDPTYQEEIIILNVHSHPQAGENWVVSFETVGNADLTITPNDQQTINDLDFISLSCNDQERIPQILEGDVIFYPNWSCEGIGTVIHFVKVARRHVLKFQFGDQTAYAFNTPWYNTNWLYRAQITINHTKVANNQTNFPVLISTTSSNLSSKAASDGSDILFTQSDGTTKLNHEIDQYTSSTGNLVAWVSTNISSTTDTVLYMYYGNSLSSNQQNATSVWDSDYKIVYHMNDSTTLTVKDSTQNGNTGYKTAANTPIQATGEIGNSQQWTTTTAGITSTSSINLGTSEWTAECWYKSASTTNQVLSNNRTGSANYEAIDLQTTSSKWRVRTYTDNSAANGYTYSSNTANAVDGVWRHVVVVRDNTNSRLRIYINGAEDTTIVNALVTSYSQGNNKMTLGKDPLSTVVTFSGYMDEYRLSLTKRSLEWITTEYNNQSSTATFETFGSEEAQNQTPGVGTITFNGGNNITLVESATTTVTATATVSDGNGYTDIASVTGKIYRSGVTSDCSDDNNNCYSNSACATSSCSVNSCTATCSYNVWFHADPTDASSSYPTQNWEAWIKAVDKQNASSSATSSGVEMNTLYAFDTAQLYEGWQTSSASTTDSVYGKNLRAQTFTIGYTGANSSHTLKHILLRAKRTNYPSTTTVSIKTTDGAGAPTGSDLTSASVNVDNLPREGWIDYQFSGYQLNADTKYAIVVAAPYADNSLNFFYWYTDTTTQKKTNMNYCTSTDSGGSWDCTNAAGYTALFEEYEIGRAHV